MKIDQRREPAFLKLGKQIGRPAECRLTVRINMPTGRQAAAFVVMRMERDADLEAAE